jgi:DNA-binding transcriptional LysR family regulator
MVLAHHGHVFTRIQALVADRRAGLVRQLGRERRILLTVNQFFTAGRVVANSDLITVLPKHLIASTGVSESLVWRELPFTLPAVNLDMLWHERDARSPAHMWLRKHLESMDTTTTASPAGL